MATQQDFDTVWGSTGAVTEPSVAKQNLGWIAEIPPHQTQNWWQNRVDLHMEYMQERGLALYNAAFTYVEGSIVVFDTAVGALSDFKLFVSLQDANTGNTPALAGTAWWLEYGTTSVLPRGFLDGFRIIQSVVDVDHDLDFQPGECAMYPTGSLPGETQLRFRATLGLTKIIDGGTWTSGNNGRLGGVALAASTWYRLFAIGFGATGIVDYGFDAAGNERAQALVALSSHTHYRQIGWMRTDAALNIVPFFQDPNDPNIIRWSVPTPDEFAASWTTGSLTKVALAPPDSTAILNHYIKVDATGGDAEYVLMSSLDDPNADVVPSSSAFTVHFTEEAADMKDQTIIHIPVNGSSSYRWRATIASAAGDNLTIVTHGYRYNRGKE